MWWWLPTCTSLAMYQVLTFCKMKIWHGSCHHAIIRVMGMIVMHEACLWYDACMNWAKPCKLAWGKAWTLIYENKWTHWALKLQVWLNLCTLSGGQKSCPVRGVCIHLLQLLHPLRTKLYLSCGNRRRGLPAVLPRGQCSAYTAA
jgi:hypothetical protein